jgi:cytochrome c oxidase cbb3-type subunit 1
MVPSTTTPLSASFVSTDPELAAVDASVRVPVMTCFLCAVHWLVVGTFLLVYASSLTHPQDSIPILGLLIDLSQNFSIFTYGHVWPAAIDTLIYGWASTAGLGLAIWVLARTSRSPLRASGAVMTGVIFWNLGVAVGLTAIFLGDSTGIELLEFPACASWILWLSFAVIAYWAILTFLGRKAGSDHSAQAWILSGLLAFPWLYAGGAILLASHRLPGSNVIQGVLDAWYVHGIYTLWLAPIGLGVLYYLIPKLSGLAVKFPGKVGLAFWTWLIFAPWTAVHDLVGGPFPADTVTLGLILSGLIFIPVALIGLNLIPTAIAGDKKQHGGIVLPFLMLAAMVFVAAGLAEQILSIRSMNQVLRFTMFREADTFLWLYGFFSFTVFGAIYYIVPRLLDFGWRSSFLVRAHYYASLYGIMLVITLLGFGGLTQGFALEDSNPSVTIATAANIALSFHIGTTMCLALVSIGNGLFAFQLGWTFLAWLYRQVRAHRLTAEILLEPYNAPTAAPIAAPSPAVPRPQRDREVPA